MNPRVRVHFPYSEIIGKYSFSVSQLIKYLTFFFFKAVLRFAQFKHECLLKETSVRFHNADVSNSRPGLIW